ncbi:MULTISPECIES: alpha/beta fold hydrolase [unclassified Thiocapsa]|uniref:alpha/beta fold hydrolase n=1 Tax=unclassified Thiocapsa TaxID=2641286 RepID=UPI0035B0C518
MIERASIDDIEIAYRIFGPSRDGVPVLMIMGYGGLMEMWPPMIVETLARKRPVIVFDNRGMGYSTSSEQDYSITRFAADSHALLQALDIDRAHVLGWSMGSYIAQELALTHPESVEQLVLLSASCGGTDAIWPDEAVWRRLVDLSGTLEERIRRMFENLFPADWLRETPDPMQVFPPITAPIDDANLLRQADTLRAWPGVCPRLSEIAAPTLLMTGTEDVVIPPRNAWIIAERIAGASVIQIKGGGHGFFYQSPELTARYLAAFLDKERVSPHPGGF